FLEFQGKLEEGRVKLMEAQAADPLNPMYLNDLASNSYQQGKYDDVLTIGDRVRKAAPDYPFPDVLDAMAYAARRDWPRALASYGKARMSLGAAPFLVALIAQAQGRSGDRAAAEASLAELQKISKSEYVPAFCFALVYYALGDRTQGYSFMRQ